MFESYYAGAKKNNIPIGAYSFFRFTKSGLQQAENFLFNVKGKDFDLPFVINVEEWG